MFWFFCCFLEDEIQDVRRPKVLRTPGYFSLLQQRTTRGLVQAAHILSYLILFYDIECDIDTGIPILIAFSFFDPITQSTMPIRNMWKNQLNLMYIVDNNCDVYITENVKDIFATWRTCISSFMASRTVYLMAYNGNAFDHLLLLNGKTFDSITVKGNNLLVGQFHYHDVKFICRDLRNYITTGNLASIGKQINCNKLPFDPESNQYVARDVTIMVKAWKEIVLTTYKYLLGVSIDDMKEVINYSSTATLAYNYVAKCARTDFFVCSSINDYLAQAYYGAKCDYSFLGTARDIVMYDITSMYPAAMTMEFPCGEMSFHETWTHNMHDKMYIGLVHLVKRVRIDSCSKIHLTYGVVPCKVNDKTEYVCAGDITAVMTSVDVQNAVQDGWTVCSVTNAIVWKKKARLFQKVYNFLFDKKKSCTKDSPEYWFAKIVMNASIGKFASPVLDTAHYVNYFCMSHSRSMLVEMKRRLLLCSIDLVLYGDTDSIVLFKEDADVLFARYPQMLYNFLSNNCIDDIFGNVDATGDITICGKKLYYIDENKFSAKGHNRAQLTREHFVNALNNENVVTTRESPYREVTVENNKLRAHITPFVTQSRTLRVTTNELKHRHEYIYTGPVLRMH